jgi:hypothetical protein
MELPTVIVSATSGFFTALLFALGKSYQTGRRDGKTDQRLSTIECKQIEHDKLIQPMVTLQAEIKVILQNIKEDIDELKVSSNERRRKT